MKKNENLGLYDPAFEHDACGIGFVAHIKGIKAHQNVDDALTILENMEHRGACGCEINTGDGAGIMIQIPHEFFFDELLQKGIHLPDINEYGVGFIFFPAEKGMKEECQEIFARAAEKLGIEIIGYRTVPINKSTIGRSWNKFF
jgi:glutamate synthase (NADPH) large chain